MFAEMQEKTKEALRDKSIRLKDRLASGSKRHNKKRRTKNTTTRRCGQVVATRPRHTVAEILTENRELKALFDRAKETRERHLQSGLKNNDLNGFYGHEVYPALVRVFRAAMLDPADLIYVESALYHHFVEGEHP